MFKVRRELVQATMRAEDRNWSGREETTKPQCRDCPWWGLTMLVLGSVLSISLGWKLYVRMWLEVGRSTGHLMAGLSGWLAHSLPMVQPSVYHRFFKNVQRTSSLMVSNTQRAFLLTGTLHSLSLKFIQWIYKNILKFTLNGSQSSFFEVSRKEPESHWPQAT